MSNIRSSRSALTLAEADSFVTMIGDMAEAQDSMSGRTIIGSDAWVHPNTLAAMERWGLELSEVVEWRSLIDRGFSNEEAAQIMVRSRR